MRTYLPHLAMAAVAISLYATQAPPIWQLGYTLLIILIVAITTPPKEKQ